jgi:hypothetical protein
MHIFWVAGCLLLALIDLPDFGTLLRRISAALDRIASVNRRKRGRANQRTARQHHPAAS